MSYFSYLLRHSVAVGGLARGQRHKDYYSFVAPHPQQAVIEFIRLFLVQSRTFIRV